MLTQILTALGFFFIGFATSILIIFSFAARQDREVRSATLFLSILFSLIPFSVAAGCFWASSNL